MLRIVHDIILVDCKLQLRVGIRDWFVQLSVMWSEEHLAVIQLHLDLYPTLIKSLIVIKVFEALG